MSNRCIENPLDLICKGSDDIILHDRRVNSKENIELIYNVSLTLMQTLDISEICERIKDSLFHCLRRIDCACILLKDPDNGNLREITSRARGNGKPAKVQYSRTLVNEVMEQGKPLMIQDIDAEDPENFSDSMERIGIKSVLCVPLISKVGTQGVIYVHSANLPQGFRKDDILFLISLSTPAALAIENALLYTKSTIAEDALEEAQKNLKKQVKERTKELVRANLKLRELSITDGLTGLYNHRYLMRMIESEFKRALRYRYGLAFLMLDIDDFKEINDYFGHPCGDYLLRHIAHLLQAGVRSTDLIGRYGGDEMAVILLEVDKRTALEISEKLRREVETCPFVWEGKPLTVTVSVGAAYIPNRCIQSWEDLLKAADQALYCAKRAGRNNVNTYAADI